MNDDLLNVPEDVMLPDLLPKSSLTSDLFHLETPSVVPIHSDLASVNFQLEHLLLETNTHTLRIEVELATRQKLRASLRQVKQSMLLPCSEMAFLR